MAAYDTLRAAIDNYIKANGNKEITGTVLNDILNAMVSALGADTRFAGVAVPSTNPGNPEGNVVYFASQAGTYSNFGGIVLPLGIHILVWNGTAWTSQTWFSVDNTPTQNSQNLATSGGILQAIVDAVGVERLRAIGAEVTSCSFDGTTKKISFFNSADDTLFQLDATAFVIDGMVSDVKIEDGNLVIQFNTDAGKQDIEIPLTDIFNPANYYTKTAIDELLALYYTKTETDALLTAIINKLADGCLYRGKAEPTTNPPTPTTKVFYIATKAGTYTNFGNIAITEGITILKYDGSNWSKEQISYSDGVFDISAYNGTNYADLSAALGTNGANIPQNLKKGGMSVKFVQISDNKYVQYRLMASGFTTTVTEWQGVDDEPITGSENLVKSGGVAEEFNKINGIFCEGANYVSETVMFTSDDIPAGTKIHIVGSATSGVYVNFYNDQDTKIGEVGWFKGTNIAYNYTLPSTFSYAKPVYGNLNNVTVTYDSQTKKNTDAIAVNTAQITQNSTMIEKMEKDIVVLKKRIDIHSSNLIPFEIKAGKAYQFRIGFASAYTGTLILKTVQSNNTVVETVVEKSNYTSNPANKFVYLRFEPTQNADCFTVQFAGYSDVISVDIAEYGLYNIESIPDNTIVCNGDYTTSEWGYFRVIPTKLKQGVNYHLKFVSENSITTEIKAGTGEVGSLMVDTIASSAVIDSTGYEVIYTPSVNIDTFKITAASSVSIHFEAVIENTITPAEKFKELSEKPVRFILITDMHYRPYEIDSVSYNDDNHAPYTSDADTIWDGVTQNERTQKWINEIKKECEKGSIDFILSTGDTIQGDNDTNKIGMSLFRERFLSQLDVPFFSCVGNHDAMYTDAQFMENFYHHREFSFECGNLYFICPDFCTPWRIADGGGWCPAPLEDHLAWMNAEVAKAKARNMTIVVASHMSQYSVTYQEETVDYAAALYNWMQENGIHLYLVGHQHVYEEKKESNFDIFRLCAGWYANRDPHFYKYYEDGWGYVIVEFKNGKFNYTHVVPEWNYKNTQEKLTEEGYQTEIGVNGYVAGSRVSKGNYFVPCKNADGAMYKVESMTNMAFCDEPITTVPSMIPVE